MEQEGDEYCADEIENETVRRLKAEDPSADTEEECG